MNILVAYCLLVSAVVYAFVTSKYVVVVETFNVSINVIGILPSPEVDTDTNPDIPIPNEYFWGNDLSGTEQGAGGVGGLVAVSVDGLFNIPCYDHNGNIVCYVSESGTIAAQYVYDPYGNVIEQHGMMPNQFNFGFSTKYLDREVGLVGYQYRFLRPLLGRWLNRDPKGEEGGVNLYAFCRNNSVLNIDGDGRAYFAVRKLNSKWLPDLATEDVHESIGGIMDRLNIQLLHEHLFFQDGKSPQNIGFCDVGIFFEDSMSGYIQTLGGYDDCIMRKAINRVSTPLYSLVGNILLGFMNKCNCQTYADMLRTEYSRLITDSSVRCDCRKEKNKPKFVSWAPDRRGFRRMTTPSRPASVQKPVFA